jgi:hypothetical protein
MQSKRAMVRGVSMQGYLEYLRGVGAFPGVLAVIAPRTRSVLLDPPLTTEWIELTHNLDLFAAYAEVAGADAVRRMAYAATRDSISWVLRPVVRSALHAFGSSPATLFSRSALLLRFSVRGQTFRYEPTGEKSGLLEIRTIGVHPPSSFFDAWAGIVEYVIEMCATTGAVEIGRLFTEGEDGVGELRVAWD